MPWPLHRDFTEETGLVWMSLETRGFYCKNSVLLLAHSRILVNLMLSTLVAHLEV